MRKELTWKKSGLSSRTRSKSGNAAFERPMARKTVALLKYVKKLSGSPSKKEMQKQSLIFNQLIANSTN